MLHTNFDSSIVTDFAPYGSLCDMLLLAAELYIQVSSVVAMPPREGVPRVAAVHVSTIHPAPLLKRLQEAGIQYHFVDSQLEGETHVERR